MKAFRQDIWPMGLAALTLMHCLLTLIPGSADLSKDTQHSHLELLSHSCAHVVVFLDTQDAPLTLVQSTAGHQ